MINLSEIKTENKKAIDKILKLSKALIRIAPELDMRHGCSYYGSPNYTVLQIVDIDEKSFDLETVCNDCKEVDSELFKLELRDYSL